MHTIITYALKTHTYSAKAVVYRGRKRLCSADHFKGRHLDGFRCLDVESYAVRTREDLDALIEGLRAVRESLPKGGSHAARSV